MHTIPVMDLLDWLWPNITLVERRAKFLEVKRMLLKKLILCIMLFLPIMTLRLSILKLNLRYDFIFFLILTFNYIKVERVNLGFVDHRF